MGLRSEMGLGRFGEGDCLGEGDGMGEEMGRGG